MICMAALRLPSQALLLAPVVGPGVGGARWPAEKFVSPAVIKSEGESAVDRFPRLD